MKTDLTTVIGSLTLKNPVMVASGTFGYGEEFQNDLYDISQLGAVVTKGISLEPRAGNPMPRVVETASGMLNAIGLPGVGVEAFVSEKLPLLRAARATVIVNIFGPDVDAYRGVAERLAGVDGVAAIEVNISCPNVKSGGIQFGVDPQAAAKVTQAVREVFPGSLIVKLSPQCSDIPGMARAVVDAGADALSLINTIPAMAIDPITRRPQLSNVVGGLSGPAIKPIALRMVREAAGAVPVPIIGMGGIMDALDAVEFLLAGATAVQVGTANFVRPMAALEIIEGLQRYGDEQGVARIADLIGALDVE